MKETRDIIDAVSGFAAGFRAVLATVLDVRGSGYRLPGARMLILPNSETVGTVSGGCLEADVLKRAERVIASGRAEVFIYDTTGDENSVFSMNMGCRGVIRILLEPVERDNLLVERLRLAYERRETQFVATLYSAPDDDASGIGGRGFISDSFGFEAYALPTVLAELPDLQVELGNFANSGLEYDLRSIELAQGVFEMAFERVSPPVSLLLFGAGADAVPVAAIASEAGWQVTVHDHRPAFLTKERFPTADMLVGTERDEQQPIAADSRTAIVIMTHNYGRDRLVLPAALRSNAFYVGALGPKRRTEQLLEEISADGYVFDMEQLARLFAPVGLDIGADTPESIALAVVAEIQSILRGRPAGHLRERDGSIYDRR